MRFGLLATAVLAVGVLGALAIDNVAAEDGGARPIAEETAMSTISQIEGIEQTKKATVVLVPYNMSFRVRLSESVFWSIGCPYVATNPSQIKSLIDILKRGDLTIANKTEESWTDEPRESVSLELENGTTARFIFAYRFINGRVRGYLDAPPKPSISYLTAKSSMPDELISWAVRMGPSIPSDRPVDDLRMTEAICSYFAESPEKSK